jgi:ribonuclease HI
MNLHSPRHVTKEHVQTIVTRRHNIENAQVAWTDGACEPNPGRGGWGLLIEGDKPIEQFGGEIETTNNRMELRAIIEAVRYSKRLKPLIVRTDSQLCLLCAVGRWKRKTNLDLWQSLDGAVAGLGAMVVYEWWRGHCGTPGNERADELAAMGRESCADFV